MKQRTSPFGSLPESFRDFVDQSNELIQCVDRHGKFLYVNKKWKKTLGYADHEIKNLRLFDIIHPSQHYHCQLFFEELVAGTRKSIDKVRVTFVTKARKEIVVEGAINAAHHHGLFISTRGIFRDITKDIRSTLKKQQMTDQLKQYTKKITLQNKTIKTQRDKLQHEKKIIEKKIKLRTKQLQQANMKIAKMLELKTEFIDRAAHDLRTPVTPLVSLAPTLEGWKLYGKNQEVMGCIIRNIHILDSLIKELLDFSRFESGKISFTYELCSPQELVEKSVTHHQDALTKKGFIVIQQIPKKTLPVFCDKVSIIEVLDNLISNAIKYGYKEGKKKNKLLISIRESRNYTEFLIKDQGIGFSEETHKRLFERFFKADASRQMTSFGLGLSICKLIMEKNNGKIWATSPGLGKGATFGFRLKRKKVKET